MTRRLLLVVTVLAVTSGALTATIVARGSVSEGAKRRPIGACRDWATTRAYEKEIAAVRPLVPRMKRAFGAPGLAVAIAADGKLVWSATCGFADRQRRVAVGRTTTFRIGSVSKTLTAAAAARLVQQGEMGLDAEVQRYVDFPRKAPAMTIRRLGGHLAGIRHYRGREALSTKHYESVTASLGIFKDDPLVAAPGTRFSYSSYGFNLLGAAVEGATGTTFAAAVKETILRPLGMTRTGLDDGRADSGRTRFYEVNSTRSAVPAPRVDLSNRFPSGGFLSTAEEIVRLGIGITNPEFVNAHTQALLFASQKTSSGQATGYGFGFEVGRSSVGPVAGHTGNVVGGTSFLLVHPQTRVIAAMTTNIGFVTVANPPPLGRGVPDPPRLAMPFIRHVLEARR